MWLDVETAQMIQELPYLQYFCGYPGYDDFEPPFDPPLMVYFRKRLTLEVLGKIYEMMMRDAKAREEAKKQDNGVSAQQHSGLVRRRRAFYRNPTRV
ncbi:transposase [Oscillibacter sp. UBA6647]|uniref:transposase n=1 Tax=Oscillibacter sp. UBA6647 TaxID=1947021 RepID=UPI0039C97DFD